MIKEELKRRCLLLVKNGSVPRMFAGKPRVTIIVSTKKSVTSDRMHAVVVSLTGAESASVVVEEFGERKIKYSIKVYWKTTEPMQRSSPS
jgi:hypothetical protein